MFYERLNWTFNLAKRERVFMGENPCRLVNAEILKNFPTWKPRERWLNQHEDEEETKLFNALSPMLSSLCRIILTTGLRPPKEILLMGKDHVNLTDSVRRLRADKLYMIPPRSIFVANGKDGTTRMIPLNQTAARIFEILVGDETTGRWLFSKNGQPIKSIKKGFSSACERAGIEDLRPYDLRHTFATRLVERNVQTIIISELLGHTQPLQGFGYASRLATRTPLMMQCAGQWIRSNALHKSRLLNRSRAKVEQAGAGDAVGKDKSTGSSRSAKA
jgi:integrase